MKRTFPAATVLALYLLIPGCTSSEPPEPVEPIEEIEQAEQQPATEPGVVEVLLRGTNFIMPDEVASGWVTFRTTNKSTMVQRRSRRATAW